MAKNRLDFQAKLSRHSHDISAGYTASIVPGCIVPQYFHILGPGDTIYYQNHMFARLQDVITAFLGEIDIHIDSFFVPLQMLYTPFGQLFAQTNDVISSLFTDRQFADEDGFPLLNVDSSLKLVQCDEFDSYGFQSMGVGIFRMLDAFDMNPLGVLQGEQLGGQDVDEQITHNPNICPWIPAAYQCIYQKYYRNDEFESLRVSTYNFDNHYEDISFINDAYLLPRYVQRPKDYFTDIRVSPISSAVNKFHAGMAQTILPNDGGSPSELLYSVNEYLSTGGNEIGTQSFDNDSFGHAGNAFNNVSSSSTFDVEDTAVGNLNTANIRALFAVDKFARIYGRADKTYDDQILAHFGIKIPHDVKHDITHLKHDRAVLQSDPVYATANTVSSDDSKVLTALGQVGGQGQVEFNTNQDKFTAPVHGVFMIVAYVTTKPRYVGTFSKLHLLHERLRFPIPEFDKLGAQPIYGFEASPIYAAGGQSGYQLSQRIGWQNRYNEFKEKYNRASWLYYSGEYGHGVVTVNSYGPWVISQMPYQVNVGNNNGVLPRGNEGSRLVRAYALFQSPASLNNVMVKPFNGNWSSDYDIQPHLTLQSDPILTEFMCNCKLVSWMSETGEPDL